LSIDDELEDTSYALNVIRDVSYTSKDIRGNEYLINAKIGEIDASDSNIIFLNEVDASIKLVDGEYVYINSDFGKYNTNNFDTIFSKNVLIKYLDNKITGDYLDFSISRNSMIVSKNVIYSNVDNTLSADVIEMNIETKDTKIFMHEDKKKVNIKNK
jgi:lipopolysaccharide assembly outer membrane protein LptD (OstA)